MVIARRVLCARTNWSRPPPPGEERRSIWEEHGEIKQESRSNFPVKTSIERHFLTLLRIFGHQSSRRSVPDRPHLTQSPLAR